MRKFTSYIAAVALTAVCMSVQMPLVSWADTDNGAVSQEIEIQYSKKNSDTQKTDDTESVVQQDAEADVQSAKVEDESAGSENKVRQNLVKFALQFVGNPYRAGGNDPHTGADCSGFVRYVMKYGAGISMNRSSREQATQGTQISASQMQPGDLLFYGSGSRINHVAMYIGDGRIVHASTEKTGIKTSSWNYRAPIRIVSMLG